MKKITTLCISLLMMFSCALTASAQDFDWGIVGGMNFSKLKFQGPDRHSFNSDQKCGWYIGPKVAFNTVIGIGVDGSVQFSQRDFDINGETEHYRTIEVPINVRYNIGLGSKLGLYVSTGPQFGFALNHMRWDNFGSGSNFSRENMNTTWNIGAGLRLLGHLELGIGYNMAMSKTGKAIFENFGGPVGTDYDPILKYRHNTIQVQVSYMF